MILAKFIDNTVGEVRFVAVNPGAGVTTGNVVRIVGTRLGAGEPNLTVEATNLQLAGFAVGCGEFALLTLQTCAPGAAEAGTPWTCRSSSRPAAARSASAGWGSRPGSPSSPTSPSTLTSRCTRYGAGAAAGPRREQDYTPKRKAPGLLGGLRPHGREGGCEAAWQRSALPASRAAAGWRLFIILSSRPSLVRADPPPVQQEEAALDPVEVGLSCVFCVDQQSGFQRRRARCTYKRVGNSGP